MSRFQLKKKSLVTESESDQTEWEKTSPDTDMTQIWELSGKDFKAAITKKTQQRNSMHQQKNFRRYREESNGNFRSNNYNNWNEKLNE